MSDIDDSGERLVRTERVKLTATYLNTAAGGLFTAGVVAPTAAAVFGVTASGSHIGPLTLLLGVAIFLGCSVGLHAMARMVLKGLKP
ncbi:hypothetical protein [Methylobacterium sp. 10]|uniref:hypothetical protein n=1 Tax=Methylobacterium sp. 10 TaxID=1101191 RepID=UPI000480410E|nr:hypothetical protein [Methylobacterium sp. 10]